MTDTTEEALLQGPTAWDDLGWHAVGSKQIPIVDLAKLCHNELKSLMRSLWAIYAILRSPSQAETWLQTHFDHFLDEALTFALLLARSAGETHLSKSLEVALKLRAIHLDLQLIGHQNSSPLFCDALSRRSPSKQATRKLPKVMLSASLEEAQEFQLQLHLTGSHSFNLVEIGDLKMVGDGNFPPDLISRSLKILLKMQQNVVLVNEIPISAIGELDTANIRDGGFSMIHKGCWNGTIVALKKFSQRVTGEAYRKEILLWAPLQGKHIVPLLGVTGFEAPYIAIMPYFEQDNVLVFLRGCPSISVNDRITFATQIAEGMSELHDTFHLCHGDLKAKNILVNNYGVASITDFGLAESCIGREWIQKPRVDRKLLPTTPRWVSPARHKTGEISKEDDIYAFGMVLWEIWTLSNPFPEVATEMIRKLIMQMHRMERPTSAVVDDHIWLIMNRCWDALPERAYSFKSILYDLQSYKDAVQEELYGGMYR